MRPTPYGEMFDVLLSNVSPEVLQDYAAILLVGDIDFSSEFVDRLSEAMRTGSRLLIHRRHAESLGTRLERLKHAGQVDVLTPWTHPATGREAAISNEHLARLADDLLPVAMAGDPIQYQINRNRQSWVIELVNNGGITKRPDQPARVDPSAVAHVSLHPQVAIQAASEWRTDRKLPLDLPLKIDVPPGQTRFVELVLPPQERPSVSTLRPQL